MKKATYVSTMTDWRGDACVYRVEPPMSNGDDGTTDYVVVSAADVPYSGPETYIFASDERGRVTSWLELDGSTRGVVSHATVLKDAGYTVDDAGRGTP